MGPGSAPADCGPTRKAPPRSNQAMDPPPAPTLWMSSMGTATGTPPTLPSFVVASSPLSSRATSVEVPPISKLMTRWRPASRARARAPTIPPAGPESSVRTGCAAATRAALRRVNHPLDFAQVAPEQRHEIGIHRHGRRALVLAELGEDFVRDAHRQAQPAQGAGHAPLVRRVGGGKKQ